VKPYFFDIAYNYIGMEETADGEMNSETAGEKKPETSKKGWFWR
jgi:hypothetical protein